MNYYQVIGWYKNIKPDNCKSSNISDGLVFSNKESAEKYAKENMTKYEIRELKK